MMPVDNLPKTLPEMEHSFEIDCEGLVTRKHYTGSFRFRIPNTRTRAMADKERARLNEGLEKGLDEAILELHQMVSYLRVTLIESPDWWKKSHDGYDLHDANVITQVYIKVLQFEKDWMVQVWGESSESGK